MLDIRAQSTSDVPPWNRRVHQSEVQDERSNFEIDRDRIIHSATFRELQYKTQVQSLLARGTRIFRTRLNHVLEVAQIARGLARRLGANEALAEAIALAHDLGHPPFGHAGERALRDRLRAAGMSGWNANVHSLDVVDRIEEAFIEFRGLDLTWATREGIARHSTPFDEPESVGEFAQTPNAGLECQIVDMADVFAYLSHDLDDAIIAGYVEMDDLADAVPLLGALLTAAEEKWETATRAWPKSERGTVIRRRLVATFISTLIRDAGATTLERLSQMQVETADDVRASVERVAQTSPEHTAAIRQVLMFLTRAYYRSSDVLAADAEASSLISNLLSGMLDRPELVPHRFRDGVPAMAAAAYIASLNDHSAAALASELGV